MVTPEEYEDMARKTGFPESLIKNQKKLKGKTIVGASKPRVKKEKKTPSIEKEIIEDLGIQYELVIESEDALDTMNLCAYKVRDKIIIQKNCNKAEVEMH